MDKLVGAAVPTLLKKAPPSASATLESKVLPMMETTSESVFIAPPKPPTKPSASVVASLSVNEDDPTDNSCDGPE